LEVRPGITGPATLKYKNEEELLSKQSDPKRYNDEVIWKDKIQINKKFILGHEDIAPKRKKDPGPYFPWFKLYKLNLSKKR